MKKRSILLIALIAFTLIISSVTLSACGDPEEPSDILEQIKNDSGVTVDGGGFKNGSSLTSTLVEASTEQGVNVINALSNVKYDTGKSVYIYEIHVEFENQRVQPNGKVTVKIPFEYQENVSYVVFHVKDNNEVEEITPTLNDNHIIFETGSFSYFVIAQVVPNNELADRAMTEEEWKKICDYTAHKNVKIFERASSENDDPSMGAQIMIYMYNGTAMSEDGYFENAIESQEYKGKISYYVKEGDKYFYVYWDEYTPDGEKWVKTEDINGEQYKWQINNRIYGLLDEYSFADMTYDETERVYKTTTEEGSVAISFTFEGNELTKIVIKFIRSLDNMLFDTTITFGDAVINVPEAVDSSTRD